MLEFFQNPLKENMKQVNLNAVAKSGSSTGPIHLHFPFWYQRILLGGTVFFKVSEIYMHMSGYEAVKWGWGGGNCSSTYLIHIDLHQIPMGSYSWIHWLSQCMFHYSDRDCYHTRLSLYKEINLSPVSIHTLIENTQGLQIKGYIWMKSIGFIPSHITTGGKVQTAYANKEKTALTWRFIGRTNIEQTHGADEPAQRACL